MPQHPRPTPPQPNPLVVYLLIALGGGAGGLARWAVAAALPTPPGAFPWSTLLINTTGSLLLGVLAGFLLTRGSAERYLRPFLGVGVLGGFTTFSTYATETRALLAAGHYPTAMSYALGSLAAGLAAASLGVRLARRPTQPTTPPTLSTPGNQEDTP